jgi:multidrug resistance efflux pump
MMRYNASNYNIEVYDGSIWKELVSNYADISLTREAEVLLDWAKAKMAEEMEYQQLSEEHPAVQIALENLKKAKAQLDATIILSKEHDETTS